MGYGIAPLVSDIPENLEAIGKCGFSFRAKSKENLEEKLAYLLNSSEEIEKMGKCAKERIKKEYSWDSITRKTLAVYELLIKNK
jgi:glycosyltransferase involved in cell wall biosynthesis